MGNYNQYPIEPPKPEDDPVLVGLATHEVISHPAVLLPMELQIIAAVGRSFVQAAQNSPDEEKVLTYS